MELVIFAKDKKKTSFIGKKVVRIIDMFRIIDMCRSSNQPKTVILYAQECTYL